MVFTSVSKIPTEAEEILYLGAWCNKKIPSDDKAFNNVTVLEYHWSNKQKYNDDYDYLTLLYERYLIVLSEKLNKVHQTEKSPRYWRIIIGPWLRHFIDVMFDRYECIRIAKEHGKITDTLSVEFEEKSLAPEDFDDFYKKIYDDRWNELIFSICGRELKLPTNANANANYHYFPDREVLNPKLKIKNLVKRLLRALQSFYIGGVKNVFVDMNLSLWTIVKINLAAGQLPIFVAPKVNINLAPVDLHIRNQIKLIGGSKDFEMFIEKWFHFFIPRNYLEAFSEFKDQSLSIYPQKPCKIITSNGYQANEAFKIFAAEMSEQNKHFYIFQHGGNYGFAERIQMEEHQIKVADKFYAWGWSRRNYKNIHQMPPIKLLSQPIKRKKNINVTIVLGSVPEYFYASYSCTFGPEYEKSIHSIANFIKHFSKNILQNTVICPMHDSWSNNRKIREKISDLEGSVKKINGDFRREIKRTKLAIVTYNGTSLLETLYSNIPTIVVWNPQFFRIREDAQHLLDQLSSAGVFYTDYNSARLHLESVYDSPEKWWDSNAVQKARQCFCNYFANDSRYNQKTWLQDFTKDILDK